MNIYTVALWVALSKKEKVSQKGKKNTQTIQRLEKNRFQLQANQNIISFPLYIHIFCANQRYSSKLVTKSNCLANAIKS